MRILLATGNRSTIGGAEKYLRSLIPALLARGHAVAALYEHPAGKEAETVDPPGQIPIWYAASPAPELAAWREIDEWRPDVVYSHNLESVELEDLLLSKYRSILYIHTHRGTCLTGKCHAFPRQQPCHRQFGPMCLALFYPRRCGGLNPVTAWRLYSLQTRRRSRLGEFRKILTASRYMYHEYARHGVRPEKLEVLELPLTDLALEAAPYAPKLARESILFAGRLMPYKGADFLIRALPEASRKLNRRLTLTIMGDGPDRDRLETLAHRLGVQVRFTGWLASEWRLEIMRNADLLAVPSLAPETFGLVGIEAGCLSVPAVAYAAGAIPDWLIPGKTGELAPADPPTVAGLAGAIVRTLADPDHYGQLCRGAWLASRQYTMQKHLNQLESIFRAAVLAAPDRPLSFPSNMHNPDLEEHLNLK